MCVFKFDLNYLCFFFFWGIVLFYLFHRFGTRTWGQLYCRLLMIYVLFSCNLLLSISLNYVTSIVLWVEYARGTFFLIFPGFLFFIFFSLANFEPEGIYCFFIRNEIVAWGHWQAPVTNQVELNLPVHLQPPEPKALIFVQNPDFLNLYLQKHPHQRIFSLMLDMIEEFLKTVSLDKRRLR